MRTVSSREVYRNPWISVREDEVERDHGRTGTYAVVDKPDFALVVPQDDDGFWLVEQFRYPVRRRGWEFPQGTWGNGHTGSPEDLARAELAEETGLRAAHLEHLGFLYPAYGLSSQGFHVYRATGLVQGPVNREETERDMRHGHFPAERLRSMIRDGDIVDAGTVAALCLLQLGLSPTA